MTKEPKGPKGAGALKEAVAIKGAVALKGRVAPKVAVALKGSGTLKGPAAPKGVGDQTLKGMPVSKRPRERLVKYGPERLSDQELLAIIIGSGSTGESALGLAERLLRMGDGNFVVGASAQELSEVKGIGEAKACRIIASMELALRLIFTAKKSGGLIRGPKDAADLLQSEIGFLDREAVRAISLNSANMVIAIDSVSLGGLAAAPVHPREIFKAPLKRSAAAIILAHNHPSGDVKPSKADLEETKRLAAAGELLGIRLFDHIIVSRGRHYSMLEDGKMPCLEGIKWDGD